MRFAEQDRRVMFNSMQHSQQLQKFLMRRRGYGAPLTEVRDLFSDLSRGAFSSLLISARARGQIVLEDDMVRLDVEKADIRTSIKDVVWKDIRMLRTFTVKQVCEDTGLSSKAVTEALRAFCNQGLVSRSPKVVCKPTTYHLESDSVARPMILTRSTGKAAGVYEVLMTFTSPFSIYELKRALRGKGVEVSDRYLKELMASWRDAGIVSVTRERSHRGQRNEYVVVDRRPRPAVFRRNGRRP